MKKIVLVLVALLMMEASAFAGRPPPVIFNHIGNDLKYTFGGWPMLLLTAGAFATPMIAQSDTSIASHYSGGRKLGKFDSVMDVLGSPYVVDTSSVLIYGIGKIIKDEDVAMTGEAMFEALLITEGLTGGMKLAFSRDRPNGGSYGFPSSHASRTFCVATVLEILHGPWFGVPAYMFAGAVGYSRIDKNVHYLSDVFFGAVLGSAIGWGTANFHQKLMNDRYSITPMVGEVNGLNIAYRF